LGSYEVNNYTIAEEIKKKSGDNTHISSLIGNPNLRKNISKGVAFSSKEKRFAGNKKVDEVDSFLGPGYYEHKSFVNENESQNKSHKFLSGAARFSGMPQETPGPGYYQGDMNSRWLKRSFNMIFAD
jgi:hypothetical protein